jgi:type I restriction enzyme S subunit
VSGHLKLARLDSLAAIVGGGTPSKANSSYFDGTIPWVTPKDMKNGFITDTEDHISDEALENSSSRLVPENSVLVVVRSGVLKHTLPVALTGVPVAINQDMKALICNSDIDPSYLAYALKSRSKKLLQKVRGTTADNVPVDELKALPIPVLSLPEQKRIAAILDKTDGIRRKRQQALQLADEFLRSLFLDMFGDPNSPGHRWRRVQVGEVCTCIVPGRDKPKSFTGTIPWITTEDLVPDGRTYLSKKGLSLTRDEIDQVRAKIVPAGSVLMTCVGELGTTSIAGCDLVMNQQLHSFQCSERVVPEFLHYAIPFNRSYLAQLATSTTIPYLNKSACNSIPIPLPRIELQKDFASVAEKLYAEKERVRRLHCQDHQLERGLTLRAFRGEL